MPLQIMSFEQLVDLLDQINDPYELARRKPEIVAGLQNLRDRFRSIEKSRMDDQARMQTLESLTTDEKTELASVAKDRTALQQGLAAAEARIDALEKKAVDKPLVTAPVDKPLPATDKPAPTIGPSGPTFLETLKNPAPQPQPVV